MRHAEHGPGQRPPPLAGANLSVGKPTDQLQGVAGAGIWLAWARVAESGAEALGRDFRWALAERTRAQPVESAA